MYSITLFLREYEEEGRPHLRMGQYFVNKYITMGWPKLFYEEKHRICIETIAQWLIDHNYINILPPVSKYWTEGK